MYNGPVSIFNQQKRPRQALYADPQSQGSTNRQTNVQPKKNVPDLMPVQGFSLNHRLGDEEKGIHQSSNSNILGNAVYPAKAQEIGRRGSSFSQSKYQNDKSKIAFQSQGQNAQNQTWKRTLQNTSQVSTLENTQQLPIQSHMKVSCRKRMNETPQNNRFSHSINSLQQRSGAASAQRALKFDGDIPYNVTPTSCASVPSLHSIAKRPSQYNTASLMNLTNPSILSPPSDSEKSVKLEKSVEEKISLNKGLHVITATIAYVKKWNKYKEKIPLIFEVFGVVDSALVKDSSGMAKEFLLRDEHDSIECIFYEIDRSIPRLTRGQWHRLVGNFNERCQKFHCVSVRTADQEERTLGKRLVILSTKTMETVVETLQEV